MYDNKLHLELISEENCESYDYDERVRTYNCPCGEGTVVWSYERSNGNGFGHRSSFSDVFCYCDNVKHKYDVKTWKGYAIPE